MPHNTSKSSLNASGMYAIVILFVVFIFNTGKFGYKYIFCVFISESTDGKLNTEYLCWHFQWLTDIKHWTLNVSMEKHTFEQILWYLMLEAYVDHKQKICKLFYSPSIRLPLSGGVLSMVHSPCTQHTPLCITWKTVASVFVTKWL